MMAMDGEPILGAVGADTLHRFIPVSSYRTSFEGQKEMERVRKERNFQNGLQKSIRDETGGRIDHRIDERKVSCQFHEFGATYFMRINRVDGGKWSIHFACTVGNVCHREERGPDDDE